jgi:hypothetical protein
MNDRKAMTGGCVCGAVTWEIDGEPARFFHCHCSRCRRTTGTGHASNLIVPITEEIRWTGSNSLPTFAGFVAVPCLGATYLSDSP